MVYLFLILIFSVKVLLITHHIILLMLKITHFLFLYFHLTFN